MGARGLSYAEIAQQLQVSRASIGSDVQYLREQAKGTIKNMLPETSAVQQTIIASEHSSDYVSALLSKGLVDIKVFPLFCLTLQYNTVYLHAFQPCK